jgi:hypothetical protein
VDRYALALEAVAKVEDDVKSGEIVRLSRALDGLARMPTVLPKLLPALFEAVKELGAEEIMLDRLLAPNAKTWGSMPAIRQIGGGFLGGDYFDKFAEIVRGRAASQNSHKFNQFGYLFYRGTDQRVLSLLCELKYPGLPKQVTAENLFECAEIAAKDIEFNTAALDFLFENRSKKRTTRKAWESEIRLSWTLQHLMLDYLFPLHERHKLVSREAGDQLYKAFQPRMADVVAYHHGGFDVLRRYLESRYPDSHILRSITYFTKDGDTSGPIVHAMRHVLRGGMVGIAPDGVVGDSPIEISVLGRKASVKPGAAMLAYDSRARTSFFTMGREGRSFVPVLEFGPERRKRETFQAYLGRYAKFYEACMNDFFSGPPQNIIFNGGWMAILAGIARKV